MCEKKNKNIWNIDCPPRKYTSCWVLYATSSRGWGIFSSCWSKSLCPVPTMVWAISNATWPDFLWATAPSRRAVLQTPSQVSQISNHAPILPDASILYISTKNIPTISRMPQPLYHAKIAVNSLNHWITINLIQEI